MPRIKSLPARQILAELQRSLPGLSAAPESHYGHALQTRHGRLLVSACDGAIRTRFEVVPDHNPAGAPLNPFSGKWNFEGIDTLSDLTCAVIGLQRIAEVSHA